MGNETEDYVLDPEKVRTGVINHINNPKVIGQHAVAFVKVEEAKEKPVGFIDYYFEINLQAGGMLCNINYLYVVPENRGRGVFKALYNYMVE